MSSLSELTSALEFLQINNYASLIGITAIAYDYLLIFSREVDYIWLRPWSWVSTIYVIVRYVGLTMALLNGFHGTTFIPGPEKLCAHSFAAFLDSAEYSQGSGMFLTFTWEYEILIAAADWSMILRVYAMWNRSKIILGVLTLILVVQTIVSLVFEGIYYNPSTHLTIFVARVAQYSFCSETVKIINPLDGFYAQLPRLILSVALLALLMAQTLRRSINMYRATKQWQINRYIKLLVRDGLLYFVASVLNSLIGLVQVLVPESQSTLWYPFFAVVGNFLFYITVPRFIIDVRELYLRGLRESWQGIDSGFGVSAYPHPPAARAHAVTSAIEFGADVIPMGQAANEIMERSENQPDVFRLETFDNGRGRTSRRTLDDEEDSLTLKDSWK